MEKEICICAAIKTKSGLIIRGHRHSDCIEKAFKMKIDKIDMLNEDQGFITSRNRFVGSKKGRKLQDSAGIKSHDPSGYRGDILFSEDLY